MTRLRAFFHRHRAITFAVIALALAMKVLMPAGTMIGSDARTLTIQICDGYADAAHGTLVIAIKPHGDGGKTAPDHQACPYAALGLAGLTGADAIQLGAALAFIVLLGLAGATALAPLAPTRLRPPLRAPPALA